MNNAKLRQRARRMYETEPITLKEISERLRINYNTIRSWKYTDSITEPWKENFKHRHRRMTQKQGDSYEQARLRA